MEGLDENARNVLRVAIRILAPLGTKPEQKPWRRRHAPDGTVSLDTRYLQLGHGAYVVRWLADQTNPRLSFEETGNVLWAMQNTFVDGLPVVERTRGSIYFMVFNQL
jgi:hypothetical protein